MSAERLAFEKEVRDVEQWWKVCTKQCEFKICFLWMLQSPRFKRTTRPYSAADVVSKRGTIPISYPSDLQGKKLFKLLSEHWKTKTPSHTYGA